MEPILLREAEDAMAAVPIGPVEGAATSICTDTREGAAGSLFFALKGENMDGHGFVPQALQAGALAAVVDHEVPGARGTQLLVKDTLRALGDLAARYRARFRIPMVAITGSVGKTSTKEMVAVALGARYRVLASEKNFNNEIGVPKTLFALSPEHQAAVVEMGMRGPGQIAELARIAQPTVGLITNVGVSHIELLGSRDAIAEAKAEILSALPPEGFAVLNADDDYLEMLKERAPARVLTFGTGKSADFRASDIRFTPEGEPRFTVRGQRISIHAPGGHHIANAAAACAVAAALDIPLAEVADQLARVRPSAMRMETVEAPDGTTILNDAYNAAPDSMRSALETLEILAGRRRRKVAVLGEMKELGAHSRDAHQYVGHIAAECGVDLLVTVGPMAREIGAGAGYMHESVAFDTTDAAARAIRDLVEPGDLVLVKGSRAMAMEKVVEALARR